jgi:1,4-alpha-glucan branching enzyme
VIRKRLVETPAGPIVRVTFALPHSIWADRIYLVGEFNDWSCTTHPLQRDRDGNWSITVDLEPMRAYQFRYLCDGARWINDSQADAYELNPFGSDNFVVLTDPELDEDRGQPE